MLRFVLVGCAFGLAVELLYKFVGTLNPIGFFFALAFYPVYMVFVYFSAKLFDLVRSETARLALIFFSYGLVGILFEWSVLGNSPAGNPNASQVTMFSMWASSAVMPKIFADRGADLGRLHRAVRLSLLVYVLVSIAGVVLAQPVRFFWVIVLSYVFYNGLVVFYVWYLVTVRRRRVPPLRGSA